MKKLFGLLLLPILIVAGCTDEEKGISEQELESNPKYQKQSNSYSYDPNKFLENEHGKFKESMETEFANNHIEIGTKVAIRGSYGTEFIEGDKKTFTLYQDIGGGRFLINDLYKKLQLAHEDKIIVFGTYTGINKKEQVEIDAIYIEKE